MGVTEPITRWTGVGFETTLSGGTGPEGYRQTGA